MAIEHGAITGSKPLTKTVNESAYDSVTDKQRYS